MEDPLLISNFETDFTLFLGIEMSTILKTILIIIGIFVFLLGIWLVFLWSVCLAFGPPSQKDAITLTSNFIGFQIDKKCTVNDWDAKSIPDLIVTCTFVLPDGNYQELLSYCESQVGYLDPQKTEPVEKNDEEYIFADYRPEEMKSLTVRVSRNKPEVYLNWWEN